MIPPSLRETEPIPADEELFRALRQDDMEELVVLPSAVDLQGTSVHRSRYLDSPEQTFRFVSVGFTGLAVVSPGDLPGPFASPGDERILWELFVVDDPYRDGHGVEHVAHAEIRVRRLSDRPGARNVRPRGAMKALLGHSLSRAMRLHTAP